MWHSLMLWRIKGRTTDKFVEWCLLWERGAYFGAESDLFNFQDLLQSQEPIKHAQVEENSI